MSHLTKVRTKLNDPAKIQRALAFLGLEYKKNSVIESLNKVPECDFVITNAGYWNVGLHRVKDGTFEVVGDSFAWGKMAEMPKLKNALKKAYGDKRKDAFAGILAQACAVTSAVLVAVAQGQKITVSDPDEDGIIRARVEELTV